ncbi:MAG: hypothetical protein KBF11_08415, partial [Desulfomicrobium sp.]|nr:hypothetical protein [Desulfomicrobium sp.]
MAVRKGNKKGTKKFSAGLKAHWRHGFEPRRLSDRARHRLLNRCLTRCQKFSALHATIQLYEASEGVPAGLKTMPPAGRASFAKMYRVLPSVFSFRSTYPVIH